MSTIDGVWEHGGGRVSLRFLSSTWSVEPSPVTREVVRGWLIRAWWIFVGLTILGGLLNAAIGAWGWLWYVPAVFAVGMLAAWLCLRALTEAVALLDDFFGIRRRLRRKPNRTRQLRQREPEPPRYVVDRRSVSRIWVDQRFLRATVTVRTVDGRGATYDVYGPSAPGRLIARMTELVGERRIVRHSSRRSSRTR